MARRAPFEFTPDPDADDELSISSQSAAQVAATAVAKRIDRLFTAGGAGFRQLAMAHATAVAGDTAVTLALAGTLFFSVPSSEARGNVALYLLLTVAPFAVIGPLLGRLLDHNRGSMRLALVSSASVRVGVCALGVTLAPRPALSLVLDRMMP